VAVATRVFLALDIDQLFCLLVVDVVTGLAFIIVGPDMAIVQGLVKPKRDPRRDIGRFLAVTIAAGFGAAVQPGGRRFDVASDALVVIDVFDVHVRRSFQSLEQQ
jgi:hypothetical protein